MKHAQPRQYFAATQRAVSNADAIEWEELPSLAKRLIQRARGPHAGSAVPRGANDSHFQASTGFASPWDSTVTAAFDPTPVSQPFHEPIAGLATREVNEPDVFLHFFGPDANDR